MSNEFPIVLKVIPAPFPSVLKRLIAEVAAEADPNRSFYDRSYTRHHRS